MDESNEPVREDEATEPVEELVFRDCGSYI